MDVDLKTFYRVFNEKIVEDLVVLSRKQLKNRPREEHSENRKAVIQENKERFQEEDSDTLVGFERSDSS